MSTHTVREGPTRGTVVAGAISFVLIGVLAVILLQIVFFLMRDDEVERKFVENEEAEMLHASQLRALDQPARWADEAKTRVAMPIDAAMDAVVRRHAAEEAAR